MFSENDQVRYQGVKWTVTADTGKTIEGVGFKRYRLLVIERGGQTQEVSESQLTEFRKPEVRSKTL